MSEAREKKPTIYGAVSHLLAEGFRIGIRVFIPPFTLLRNRVNIPPVPGIASAFKDHREENFVFDDSEKAWRDNVGVTLKHLNRVQEFVRVLALTNPLRFESALAVFAYQQPSEPSEPDIPFRYSRGIRNLYESGKKDGRFADIANPGELYERILIERFVERVAVTVDEARLAWVHPRKLKKPRHILLLQPVTIDADGVRIASNALEYALLLKERRSTRCELQSMSAKHYETQILDLPPTHDSSSYDAWLGILASTQRFDGELHRFLTDTEDTYSQLRLPEEEWDDTTHTARMLAEEHGIDIGEEGSLGRWNESIAGFDRRDGMEEFFWSLYVNAGKIIWKEHRSCGYCGRLFIPKQTKRKTLYCSDICRERMNALRSKGRADPEAQRERWREYSYKYIDESIEGAQ